MHLEMDKKTAKKVTYYDADSEDEEVREINSPKDRKNHENVEMYNGVPINVIMEEDQELENSSTHVPIKQSISEDWSDEEGNDERSLNVPTPVNLNLRDIIDPLDEWARVQQNITERKYPVLPSIGRQIPNHLHNLDSQKPIHVMDTGTINQLDFTREKMESEADFFADFRLNTSFVKVTPRQHPLPPIKQTSSLGSISSKR